MSPSKAAVAAATEISSLVEEWHCDTLTCAEIIDRHFPPFTVDEEGSVVRHGDEISFSYGIPPVRVTAMVATIDGELWALTPDHNPPRCKMSELREHVGSFYKNN